MLFVSSLIFFCAFTAISYPIVGLEFLSEHLTTKSSVLVSARPIARFAKQEAMGARQLL